jgi:hypothetical protein
MNPRCNSDRPFLVSLPAALDCRGRTPYLGATSTHSSVLKVIPMKIELWKLSEITPTKAPRTRQWWMPLRLHQGFGFRQPIVVDSEVNLRPPVTRLPEVGIGKGAGPCGQGFDSGADQSLPDRGQ